MKAPGIPESQFNDRQRLLYETMSDISEECYSAGWLSGTEIVLWRAIQTGNLAFGMGEIDRDQLELCRALSAELGGWIVWIDAWDVPGLPHAEWGPRFIQLADWQAEYLLHTQPAADSSTTEEHK